MKKRNLLIIPFLVVAFGFLVYLHSFTTSDLQQLYLSVTPEESAGWSITGFVDGSEQPISPEEAVNGDLTTVLRRSITEEWAYYGTISITDCREMCIFVDNELIYSNLRQPIAVIGELPKEELPAGALFTQVFSINPEWIGKTITVLTRNYTDAPFGTISFTLLSSTVSEAQQTAWASEQAIPGTIFGVLFLLLFGLFLYGLPSLKNALPLLLLAVGALLQMLYYLDRLNTVSVLSQYDRIIQALYILVPLLYASTHMRKEKKLFLCIMVPVWGVYFSSVAAWSVFSLTVPMWFDALAYLTLLLPAILVGFSIKAAKMGNKYFKRLLQTMGLFLLGGIIIFALSALFDPSLFERFIIYWKEMVAGYPFPVAFVIFTAIMVVEFLLAIIELVESRIKSAQDMETLKMRNELTAQSLLGMEQTNEMLARVRHDELHHLRTLSALCREDPLRAADYAASLANELEKIPVMRFTENRLVNAILSIQSMNAADENVQFEAKARLPESLRFPECDVSTVLMNLLENAVQAAAKAPEEKERKVSVLLEMEDSTFLITITNSLPNDFDKDFFRNSFSYMLKTGFAQHGYGIRSAQNIVTRYRGKLRYSVRDDTITLNTAMDEKMVKTSK